jgi:ABC-2 type transport system ATP-binding protein
MIYDLADTGKSIIVTTHAMEEAEYCDLVAFMGHGRLAAMGTPSELLNQWGQSETDTLADIFARVTR